jgi:RNA polymerase sigma-70 factor (ECF subfamily)
MDFDDFFRAEQPKMVALALALTGVPEVARDLAQEALVKAYQRWSVVAAMESPGGWLRQVTINQAMSWHRSATREKAATNRLGGPTTASIPEIEGERFWSAVRELPDRQQAVVSLYYLDDQSVATVASLLDIAEGTVKAALHAARRNLAASLGLTVEETRR